MASMKELFGHIERLLTGHDCVVVPGLGGFVLHEVHFSVGEDGSIFRPGGKDISFNVRLTFNDGILVQAYQEKYQLTFEAAVETIREEVATIHAALNEGHIIPVGRLGTLRKNEEGHILFRPDNRNLFCPECYGLSSYVFHTMDQRALETEKPNKKKKREKKKDDYIHIRLSRHTFSNVLTGVAACLLFLLVSKPAGELKQLKTQEAFLLREYFMSGLTPTSFDTLKQTGLVPLPNETTRIVTTKRTSRKRSKVSSTDDIDSLFGTHTSNSTSQKSKKLLPSTDDIDSLFGLISFIASGIGNNDSSNQQAARKQKNGSVEDTTTQNAKKKPTPTNVTAPKNKVPQNTLPRQRNPTAQVSGKTYNIIISSHPSKTVATKWLSNQGNNLYEQAEIIEGDGRARVSIRHFDNKVEAENFLRQFRKENPKHADAWLLPTAI